MPLPTILLCHFKPVVPVLADVLVLARVAEEALAALRLPLAQGQTDVVRIVVQDEGPVPRLHT